MVFTIALHVICALMFVVGGIKSKGKINVWSFICTLGVLILGLGYTGVLGSFIALF